MKFLMNLECSTLHLARIPRALFLAGTAGFEPAMTGPEPVALPLGYVPMLHLLIYTNGWQRQIMPYYRDDLW